MSGFAHLLLAHGSRDPRWLIPFENLAQCLRHSAPERSVYLCYLELAQPRLLDCIRQAVARHERHLRISPLFMAGGIHLERDLPKLLAEAENTHPGIRIQVDPPLGDVPDIRNALLDFLRTDPNVSKT